VIAPCAPAGPRFTPVVLVITSMTSMIRVLHLISRSRLTP
jgi:hypothetical protein